MKLRIKDDTLRLRLTVTEVASIADGGQVMAQMALPDRQKFVYQLLAGDVAGADLSQQALTVSFPRAALCEWASSDDVSLSASCDTGDGSLLILVEKDFACLTPREGNDDADTFEHPRAGSESC